MAGTCSFPKAVTFWEKPAESKHSGTRDLRLSVTGSSCPTGIRSPSTSSTLMWPTAFALKDLTAAEEAKIGTLVKKAVG
jgi:hypothetical protein